LARRPGKFITATMHTLASDGSAVMRRTAAEALARRPGEGIAALFVLATDPTAKVRRAAARALIRRPGDEVTAALLTLLADPSSTVRRIAAQGLAGRPSAQDLHVVASAIDLSAADPEAMQAVHTLVMKHYKRLSAADQLALREAMRI
jgi:hypothetical protein